MKRLFLVHVVAILFLCAPSPLSANEISLRERVVGESYQYKDVPYRYGGRGSALDCSELTQTVFKQQGIKLPRTVRGQAQSHKGQWVEEPSPGDLVFFKNTAGRGLTHVGIYVGKGNMVHASTTSKRVEEVSLDNPYFKKHLYGYKSFLDEDGSSAFASAGGVTEPALRPQKSLRQDLSKGSALPFWVAASGMVVGTVGGLLANDNTTRAIFAGSGFVAFGLGVTWGGARKAARFSLASPLSSSRVATN